jgi:hypothetical protein
MQTVASNTAAFRAGYERGLAYNARLLSMYEGGNVL